MSEKFTHTGDTQGSQPPRTSRAGKVGVFSRFQPMKLAVFLGVGIVWLIVDLITKHIANAADLGSVFAGPFGSLVQFKLIHNTGAAWSMFSGATAVLGVVALMVVAVLVFVIVRFGRMLSLFEVVMLGLVLAGGLGNALDRFTLGYVIDFIQVLFISFPTFNVADIGVTCGVIGFIISFGIRTYKQECGSQNAKEGK
ncbi:MAG: signal peptidase II [Eggerthellaceae bacterium]